MQHATIVNTLPQALGVSTASFSRTIPSGKTDSEVPVDVAAEFKSRPIVQHWIRAGKVRVLIPKAAGVEEPEVPEALSDVESFKSLAWKEAVSRVNATTDLDILETLYVEEDRKRVQAAIETRIKFLTEDTTTVEVEADSKHATES